MATKLTDKEIVLLESIEDSIEMVYVNDYKRRYYPILAGFMVDYKE